MSDEYIVVTTVQTFRHKYVVPVSALEKDGADGDPVLGAMDWVTLQEVEEFSQEWLGEQIVDAVQMSQEKVLELVNKELPYIKTWTEQQKIDFINAWNEELTAERIRNFQYEPQERYHDYILRKEKEHE